MPLMKKASKKAFEHNIKAEMHAGKPQDQALAISYSVKRRAKKKYAEGGAVSANDEKRPMPEDKHNDSKDVAQNSSRKDNAQSDMTSRPDIKQATKGIRTTPIKHPSMTQSPVFKARLRDQEDDLMDSASPGAYGEQPSKAYDEEDADKSGPEIHDMQDSHSTSRKPYADGGRVEKSDYSARPNKYMDDLQDLDPSHDEGQSMADSHDEEGQDRQGPHVPDMEAPHNQEQRSAYAEGGMAHEMDDQPSQEEEIEHAASIAAAIMAKMKERYAEGGQVDLASNHEEEPNNEDQMSFNALRKENYNSSNLDIEQLEDSNMRSPEYDTEDINDKDIVRAIRSKMKIKSAMTKQVLLKICNECSNLKALNEFSRKLATHAAHCKECDKAKAKKYRENNKEKIKLAKKSKYLANKEKIKLRTKAYYKANLEACRKRNNEYHRKYYAKNPTRFLVKYLERRTLKERRTPKWLSPEQKAEITSIYAKAKDLRELRGQIVEVDHIEPLKGKNVCGLHVPWNLRIISKAENRSKGNRQS